MSAIEKLVKSFEALKVLQATLEKPEEALVSTKFIKRETSLTKKDKINHCQYIAEIIVSPQLRTIEDFHKFLGIAIETFLACCDDNDSDVRLAANECLNKTIKSLLDCQLGRIQVELYKEIKKNGSSRSVRASLTRFAELCHLIRPSKRRAYLTNIIPCVVKICHRTEDESIQDSLGLAFPKMMAVFARYATDAELRLLIDAFLPNLRYVLACVRRTATVSLVAICQYSKEPLTYYSLLFRSLLKLVNSITSCAAISSMQQEQVKSSTLCGVFLCFKHLIPLLDISSGNISPPLKIYALAETKHKPNSPKDVENMIENVLQLYELLLHALRTTSESTVVLSALEALNQFLRTPPSFVLPMLLSPKGMGRSRLGQDMKCSLPSSPCMSQRHLKVGSSIGSSTDVAALEEVEELNIKSYPLNKDINLTFKQELTPSLGDNVSHETLNSHEDDVDEDRQEHSFLNEFFNHGTPVKNACRSDLNKLAFVESEESFSDYFSPATPTSASQADISKVMDIGEFVTEGVSSLEYCTRLLCSHFLLAGSKKELISDKLVKVSVKSITLSCISNILQLHPRCFLVDLFINSSTSESVQKAWDVALYSSHSDPHLRGQVCLIIGNFVRHVLESCLCYNDFLLKNCSLSAFSEAPTLEELIYVHLFRVLFEEQGSSVCIRHGLNALQNCLPSMMESNETVNTSTIQILEKLMDFRRHNYWLVKVELLEVFAQLSFASMFHLEKLVSTNLPRNYRLNQGLQEYIINELYIPLLSDDDYRVRQAASIALVRLVPRLYQPRNDCSVDAVAALAEELMYENLKYFSGAGERNCVFVKNAYGSSSFDFDFPFATPAGQDYANKTVATNLKSLISRLVENMLRSVDNKTALFGLCQALSDISDAFPTTRYPDAWGCDVKSDFSCLHCVKFLLSLVGSNSWFTVDLLSHQTVLHLIGNLVSGLCYHTLEQCSKNGIREALDDMDWGVMSREAEPLVSVLESFTQHIFKILNLYTCIVEDIVPTLSASGSSSISSSKTTVIPSLSSSSLSPIRRKSSKAEPDKIESSKRSGEKEKDKTKKILQRQNSFANLPLSLRLYESMKSIYNSSKISSDISRNKLSLLLEASLGALCQVLEVGTLKFFEKYAEELLYYLQAIISVEPSSSVKCVKQLLKCIFGNNFAAYAVARSESENEAKTQTDNYGIREQMAYSLPSFTACGLYHACIASPYAEFSRYRLTVCHEGRNPLNVSLLGACDCYFHKQVDKKFSSTLEKAPANQNSSKLALTTHIRLFEPVVIKALKLYTVTSDSNFQCEVLNLLSHLVRLRVNYCLLDSDQIFIGFVEKQFEFIEKRQMVGAGRLINQIFQFLVLLSYERFHSKPIISVPKIIQMCDDLMASGQPPSECLIPAIVPFAEDLFLCRGPSRVESIKELEAQREVMMSTLLKLVTYTEIMQTLIAIVRQTRREGEEKWKRMSRQIMDVLLPLLVKQQIKVNDVNALEVLHHLFDCLSPAVFRPVDYLLKALFSLEVPNEDVLGNSFCHWFTSILAILRVLAVHVKEEVVLARLDELCFSNAPSAISNFSGFCENQTYLTSLPCHPSATTSAEKILTDFLFGIIKKVAHRVERVVSRAQVESAQQKRLLLQQVSCLMLYLTHMFQSGSYRRVARFASELIKSEDGSGDIDVINASFAAVDVHIPTVLVQWCNILMLLAYDDNGTHEFWYNLLKRTTFGTAETPDTCSIPKEGFSSSDSKPYPSALSVRYEIVRKGVLILMCDFLTENMNDVEQLTWLIVNNVRDLITCSNEIPIRDFIQTVHRNQASSGLFLQAILTRCEDVNEASFLKRLVQSVQFAHESQCGPLVVVIVEQILVNAQTNGVISVRNEARKLALGRMEYLLCPEKQGGEDNKLAIDDVNRLVRLLSGKRELEMEESLLSYKKVLENSAHLEHPLSQEVNAKICDKEWFLSFIPKYCKHRRHYKYLVPTLLKLNYEELTTLLGGNKSGSVSGELIEISSTAIEMSSDKSICNNSIFSGGLNRNMLLKVSVNSTVNQLSHIHSFLPEEHHPFVPQSEILTSKEAKHRDSLILLFSDSSFVDSLWTFGPVYISIIKHAECSRCFTLNPDIMKSMVRIGVLYAELAHFQVARGSVEYLTLLVTIMDTFFSCESLLEKLNLMENVSCQCSVVAAVHSVCEYFIGYIEEPSMPKSFEESDAAKPGLKHIHLACARVGDLLSRLEVLEKTWVSTIPLTLKSCLHRIIISLTRINVVNSFVVIPTSVWKHGTWVPQFSGEFLTTCPVIPSEILVDVEVLKQFIFRIKAIGWNSRVQFEEIWMSLFGVVAIIQNEKPASIDEHAERVVTACVAISGITSLLLQALLHPMAGNPLRSSYLRVEHTRLAPFLLTKHGEKLQKIKNLIEKSLEASVSSTVSQKSFRFGLISVEYLRRQIGGSKQQDISPSVSSGSLSTSSSSSVTASPSTGPRELESPPAVVTETLRYRESLDIDINSCIYFLLELYGQLVNSSHTQPPLVVELCKSVAYLSDLFFDRNQYEWMFDTFLELFKLAVAAEDEINLQFLALGVCKAVAVLALDHEQQIDRCKKCVEISLKSSFLPTRLNTLYGLRYLLEKPNILPNGKETLFLPMISDYILKHLSEPQLPSSHNEEHVVLIWKFAFHLIEFFVEDFNDSEFGKKIFQIAVRTISGDDASFEVLRTVSAGVERLLICEVFPMKDLNIVIKAATDRIKSSDVKAESVTATSVLITALYVSKYAYKTDAASSGIEKNISIESSDELLSTMEKFGVLFDRLRQCSSREAETICAVLAAMLCEFFPTQEVLNKIIGEFLSSQQCNRKHVAYIIYEVFNILHTQSLDSVIHNWVILSLSSFTQIEPKSMALWTLLCFLISASANEWVRCCFPCVKERIDRLDNRDEELFEVVCCSFYDELAEEEHKTVFLTTLESAAISDDVYTRATTALRNRNPTLL